MRSARTGGRILVDQLLIHGVDRAFCVPGESYLEVLDALYDVDDRIQLVVARQEGGASFMAAAHGKLTGRPGICFVTRGPGATNASIGVHSALQDSSPMILFVGQVPRRHSTRGAFQEVDFRQMFAPLAKAVFQVESAQRMPELIARAFHTAISGQPGPVVVALPEDVLVEVAEAADASPVGVVRPAPAAHQIERFEALLSEAERPLLVVGGAGWDSSSIAAVSGFAAAHHVPVATAFRFQDLVDNTGEHYAGTLGLGAVPGLDDHVREADLVMLVGHRADSISFRDYALLDVPRPAQRFVHVHPDLGELGRVYQPDLAINASVSEFTSVLAQVRLTASPTRQEWVHKVHSTYLDALVNAPAVGDIDPRALIEALQRHAPADTIITNGAGAYATWPQRYYRFRHHPSQLAPQSGAMGYGLPAAVAAALAEPHRTVVAFAGDGCFLMNGQELATAARYDLPILVIVVNNSRYGTIRLHQERRYPGRVSGTDLVNPDFVAFARAFGADAERVETVAGFERAVQRALAARRLTVVELAAPELAGH
jgi:acetolactate synthase-1/2/3 large subunit